MRRGFSLVELSIVLVILGLLTGGILAGQSLIRGAELRSVSTEAGRYTTVLYTFRDKYFAAPGDFTQATEFWGSAGGDGRSVDTACASPSDPTGTCNGNGDGIITSYTRGGELTHLWHQLTLAGLIEGKFRAGKAAATVVTPGTYSPLSKVGGSSYWFILPYGDFAGSTSEFAGSSGNMLLLDNASTTASWAYEAAQGPLLPEEAWNIDTKMDDGQPAIGKVFGYKGTTAFPCTSRANQAVAAADASATYNLSSNVKSCSLFLRNII